MSRNDEVFTRIRREIYDNKIKEKRRLVVRR